MSTTAGPAVRRPPDPEPFARDHPPRSDDATAPPPWDDTDLAPVVGDDGDLARAVPAIRARLRERFPKAPDLLIRQCIDRAVRLCAGAKVRNYLPILIERQVTDILRQQDHASTEPIGLVSLLRDQPDRVP